MVWNDWNFHLCSFEKYGSILILLKFELSSPAWFFKPIKYLQRVYCGWSEFGRLSPEHPRRRCCCSYATSCIRAAFWITLFTCFREHLPELLVSRDFMTHRLGWWREAYSSFHKGTLIWPTTQFPSDNFGNNYFHFQIKLRIVETFCHGSPDPTQKINKTNQWFLIDFSAFLIELLFFE